MAQLRSLWPVFRVTLYCVAALFLPGLLAQAGLFPADPGPPLALRMTAGSEVSVLYTSCHPDPVSKIVVEAPVLGVRFQEEVNPISWQVDFDPPVMLTEFVVGTVPTGGTEVIRLSEPLSQKRSYVIKVYFETDRSFHAKDIYPGRLRTGDYYYQSEMMSEEEFAEATTCS